jgi:multiple sugar transport system permease protein
VLAGLGLTDSYWALVVLYPTFTIPFCTWLMVAFYFVLDRFVDSLTGARDG